MQAYVYQAALLCEKCGCEVSQQVPFPEGYVEGDESSYGSDDYPKGPYGDGGGEADCPQHCDICGTFLENPLTSDGVAYVRELLAEDSDVSKRDPNGVLAEWRAFYDYIEA